MSETYTSSYNKSRGRIQGGAMNAISYPHPWFDVATTYIPSNIQSLFRQLREFFLLNGFFHTVVTKLAQYPLTDLIFEDDDPIVSGRWSRFFKEDLRFRTFQLEVGLDYYVYGNAIVTMRYPLAKWLVCGSCRSRTLASAHREHWVYRGYEFQLTCPKCKTEGPAVAEDTSLRVPEQIRLLRLDPEMVQIRYNPLTRERTYYMAVHGQIRADVMMGRKDVVESLPNVYLDACKRNEMVVIPSSEVFHIARPTVSGFELGWGCPLLLPVLKEAFQLQVMRKAQETVLLEHLVPLRVLYPQPASSTSDPFATVPLPLWKEHMAKEIARWRWDPAYIPILPLPVGQQAVGGDGKALMVQPEMQALIDHIVVCLGVPREFIFGGASWSGSNVSLRTVENMFLDYIEMQLDLVKFIQRKVQPIAGWPTCAAKFKPFRMADDIQRKQWLTGLVQAGYLSQTALLEEADFDASREAMRRKKEVKLQMEATEEQQVAQAKMQQKVQRINTQTQIESMQATQRAQFALQQEQQQAQEQQMAAQQSQQQEAMQAQEQQAQQATAPSFESMVGSKLNGGQSPGASIQNMANILAEQIAAMPQAQQPAALQNLGTAVGPEVQQLVQQMMGGAVANGIRIDKPDPEQRPPRRVQS